MPSPTGILLPRTTRCWRSLPLWLLAIVFDACGGGSGGQPPPHVAPDIAFASSRALDGSDAANTNSAQNVWVVAHDGTGAVPLTRLTANGIFSDSPAWSPAKAEIAFVSNRAQDGSDALNSLSPSWIWTVDVDGSHPTPLTTYVTDGSLHYFVELPAWSPDGLKLSALSICCLQLLSNIAVLNADGSNFTLLTSFGSGVQPESGTGPGRWSPDGSKLIFDATVGGVNPATTGPADNIWIMNADGSNQTALTNLTNLNVQSFDPNWSPDASEVAFSSSRALDGSDAVNSNSTANIWVMKADGTGIEPLTKLTAAGADCVAAYWSPDGTKLVFESARALDGSDSANANLTVNIWSVNADGTAAIPLTNLTAAGASSHNAVWSPDGSKLAFDSRGAIDGSDLANNASNIWVMNPDGSGATPLTTNTAKGADSVQPNWHP